MAFSLSLCLCAPFAKSVSKQSCNTYACLIRDSLAVSLPLNLSQYHIIPTQSKSLYLSFYRMSVQNLNSFGEIPCCLSFLLIDIEHWWAPTDPFADEGDPLGSSKDVGSQQNYIHIRIQQRNGRKTLTTLQGLPKGESFFSLSLPPHAADSMPLVNRVRFKETLESIQEGVFLLTFSSISLSTWSLLVVLQEFACNGTLVDDEEMGQVIQLQGDQRLKISNFLTEEGVPKATIKLHGF